MLLLYAVAFLVRLALKEIVCIAHGAIQLRLGEIKARGFGEMKYAFNICEANISQRSYFTRRKTYFVERTNGLDANAPQAHPVKSW